MRRWACACLLGVVLASCAAVARAEEAEDAGGWHLDLDAAYGRTSVGFLSGGDLAPTLCGDSGCENRRLERETVRSTVGMGFGTLVAEAGLEVAIPSPSTRTSDPYVSWSVGVRIDTSADSWLSLQVRLAYVTRWGWMDGAGGRGGIGLVLRPWRWIAAYVEASADLAEVPSRMRGTGTLLSYATFLGGGMRLRFGS